MANASVCLCMCVGLRAPVRDCVGKKCVTDATILTSGVVSQGNTKEVPRGKEARKMAPRLACAASDANTTSTGTFFAVPFSEPPECAGVRIPLMVEAGSIGCLEESVQRHESSALQTHFSTKWES